MTTPTLTTTRTPVWKTVDLRCPCGRSLRYAADTPVMEVGVEQTIRLVCPSVELSLPCPSPCELHMVCRAEIAETSVATDDAGTTFAQVSPGVFVPQDAFPASSP